MGLHPEQLKLPTEHLILNLEGVIVNLVYDGAVAQAKPTRSRFHPLEGGLFGAFLIFQNGIFLSVIVNEFKFAYLVRLSVLHNHSPISQLATAAVSQHLIRSFCKRLVENCPKIWRLLPTSTAGARLERRTSTLASPSTIKMVLAWATSSISSGEWRAGQRLWKGCGGT
jgi:hypothetical protein